MAHAQPHQPALDHDCPIGST
ncbi:hypothetical protein CCACVL1_06895 [Corchorus capsularis]|uniref:Uncharacterized protein n=1 Tax=Corchorus capsularis TaxID=210143 RepID=A0A1R3JBS4_COCAP|nr:hypothetical protein CCACVL1_06895 [Corchorus capsularis]